MKAFRVVVACSLILFISVIAYGCDSASNTPDTSKSKQTKTEEPWMGPNSIQGTVKQKPVQFELYFHTPRGIDINFSVDHLKDLVTGFCYLVVEYKGSYETQIAISPIPCEVSAFAPRLFK